ncbi:syntaxin-11-like [Entelurus aequoreus]|uniref:syntaxin-11-like n=1 Tax=Entelurus aequoreus TaxID=161455 RepID=UPI002B1D03FF|nr:syntaxin-11-like [Entelurus aequoreus]XP_061896773.1 syntaxin-11-like [Entelurus aequoreus]
MKDRLSELLSIASKPPDVDLVLRDSPKEDYQGEEAMAAIHREAQAARKEMLLLKMDVKRLGKQGTRFLTSVRRFSSIKRDSNALGRAIKSRGEAVYARLERLKAAGEDLAGEHGPSSTLARMACCQHASLTAAFHRAMSDYNGAEMELRENCKTRIQRQAEIVGKEVSCQQIEEMVETGKWSVFSDNLLCEGRGARSALSEIETRRRELMELEGRIRGVRELFLQMALLVEEQGCQVDNVEANVARASDYVARASHQVRKAVRYQKANPCRKLFCCCCPCCQ